MSIKTKWWLFAVAGLILIGAGFSIAGEAIIVKAGGAPVKEWFLLGTGGLIVFNAGVSVFGQGVVYRSKL